MNTIHRNHIVMTFLFKSIFNYELEVKRRKDKRFWSKWSDWTDCSPSCVAHRYRVCRKSNCSNKYEKQEAWCYEDGNYCHRWLLQNDLIKNSPKNISRDKNRSKNKEYPKKCGVLKYPNSTHYGVSSNMLRIIGGRESEQLRWPWHVALLNKNKEVFCGGTLIAPKWIITAAHCVRSVLYVNLNEHDISYSDGSEQQFKVVKYIRHPNFNSMIVDNDIALLKLPRKVNIPFACLPRQTEPKVGQRCTVMGWGKRRPADHKGSKKLIEAQLPVVSKDICKRSYRQYIITDNMFCAGYRHGGTDTCAGDSGGGLFCPPTSKFGWTVTGITSFGEGCGKRGKYGIYVNVKNYIPWLKQNIKHLNY